MIGRRMLGAGALACMMAGCGYHVRYSPLQNPATPQGQAIAIQAEARHPVSPDEVTIFVTRRPEQAYNELGVITIPTGQAVPDERTIFNLFRETAAAHGADGVIILDTQTAVDSYPNAVFGDYWGVYYTETVRSRSIFRGMAIQFVP